LNSDTYFTEISAWCHTYRLESGKAAARKIWGAAWTKTHGQSHFGCTLSVNVDQT
jgi:hypothetical protein